MKKNNKKPLFWKTGNRVVKKEIKYCISMEIICTGKVYSCKHHYVNYTSLVLNGKKYKNNVILENRKQNVKKER